MIWLTAHWTLIRPEAKPQTRVRRVSHGQALLAALPPGRCPWTRATVNALNGSPRLLALTVGGGWQPDRAWITRPPPEANCSRSALFLSCGCSQRHANGLSILRIGITP